MYFKEKWCRTAGKDPLCGMLTVFYLSFKVKPLRTAAAVFLRDGSRNPGQAVLY